jgi:hypothetical protein
MKRTTQPRATVNLSKSVQHQLNMYALAASATGVALLAAAQPVNAKIVYTPAHQQLINHKPFDLDLDHNGVNDFKFLLNWYSTTFGKRTLTVQGVQQRNRIWSSSFASGRLACAAPLPKGTRIGPKGRFSMNPVWMFYTSRGSSDCKWLQRGGTTAYLGVKFSIKGKDHFGWARFTTHSSPHPGAELTGYAYETIPGKSIIAGATKGPNDAESTTSCNAHSSEPAALAVLARGARGRAIWRREESVVASP